MIQATYKFTLYEGNWKVTPTSEVIINCLSRAFQGRPWDTVDAIQVRLPDNGEHEEGVYHVVHVDMSSMSSDAETLSDILHEALLCRLVPEYDSLLEVEQVDTVRV